MINNLQSTLINSNNYRIPVKSEPNKINSPSITHKSDGERFTLNGQVTCVPEQSKLNVSPRVATVIEANSDSCQMNQLINESKFSNVNECFTCTTTTADDDEDAFA